MPKQEKKSILSKGAILSIILHAVVIGFLLFWGVTNTTDSHGPLEVSLSTGDFGPGGPESEIKKPGAGIANQKTSRKEEPEELKEEKSEEVEEKEKVVEKKKEPVEEKTPEKVVEKEEEIPEKVAKKKKEPEKEVVKKEEVEEKEKIVIPDKKAVEEKKEVVKKEDPEKEEPAEKVIEKKEPEKEVAKKSQDDAEEEVSDKAESDSSRENVLKEIKRKSVLRDLKNRSVKTSEQVASRNDGGSEESDSAASGGGGGTGGTGSRINPIVLSTYYEVLSKRVEKVLAFPPSVELDGSYTTFVRFWMNNNGRVSNVAVDKTSGNNIIDNYCVKAVNSAAPFPSPPLELQSKIKSEPFVIPCSNIN